MTLEHTDWACPERSLQAYIDLVLPDRISGWAFDPKTPAHRVLMVALLGKKPLTVGEAAGFRVDLSGGNLGDGNHAFDLTLTPEDYLAILNEPGEVTVLAINHATGQVVEAVATGTYRESIASAAAEPASYAQLLKRRSNQIPGIRGTGHLLKNLEDFNKSLWSCVTGNTVQYYSITVQGFSDKNWYDDAGKPSATKFLRPIPEHIVEEIAARNIKLLIDMSSEGQALEPVSDFLDALHQSLIASNISLDSVVLLTQNRMFSSQYQTYCDTSGTGDRISILYYDFFPRRLAGLLRANDHEILPAVEKHRQSLSHARQNTFLCQNFTPRPWRTGLVSWLFGRGFDRRALISYRGVETRKDGIEQEIIPEWFPQPELTQKGLALLQASRTLHVDLPEGAQIPEFDIAYTSYERSYFSVVTETDVSNGDVKRITEKLLKPIGGFHPFIVSGNPGSLKILRDLGFETFHPFIDERYDDVLDPVLRIEMVMSEISRLATLTGPELHAWYSALSTTLVHNYLVLRKFLPDVYSQVIERRLLAELAYCSKDL
jgi:hypothetical protein